MSLSLAGKRSYHLPQGDPCSRCALPAKRHRVEHAPQGDPCSHCGLGVSAHYKKFHATHSAKSYYVGIDGEGQGRQDHRYVMLAWSNESGTQRRSLEAPEGSRLSSVECLDFILDTPNASRLFAFAFGYDLTHILRDLPDETIYNLFRPDLRQRKPGYEKYGPKPVIWESYSLNLVGSKFSVSRGKTRRVIWDTFKFFQAKFITALEDWKVGDPVTLARMRAMKDQRAIFDSLTRAEILAYCYDECAYMATLAHKLTEAHEAAGLKLRAYHGAGSTGSAILKKLRIDKEVRHAPDIPALQHATASAFFGGRFENSVIGDIPGPLWGYDISSAYPYQIAFLPCLSCGRWERVTKRNDLEGATTAIVCYSLNAPSKSLPWGPFPFRLESGSIAFPSESGGGYVWLAEYLEGERLFPNVQFREAWVYRTDCQHRPFAEIPKYYLERLRIGKEGPGIVIKLGCNSCYGKLAQSVGTKPPFQSWIWAGMITAGTRAQILTMLGLHRNWSNLVMVATDGIYTREKLDPPKPKPTGTDTEHRKPLGGWECKIAETGMFAARPGIYFPTAPTESDIKAVRARGVGRAVMLRSWRTMIDAWRNGQDKVRIAEVTRFHGAKSSIGRSGKPGSYTYTRHSMLDDEGEAVLDSLTGKPRPRYGQWSTRPVDLSFNPRPKREAVGPDGRTLVMRAFPDMESVPYKRSTLSLEKWALKSFALEASEQPDGIDFADYEE